MAIKIDFDVMPVPTWMMNALEKHGISPEGKTYLECEAILANIPRSRIPRDHGFYWDDDPSSLDDYDQFAGDFVFPF
jgi:hypothetical protein